MQKTLRKVTVDRKNVDGAV